MGQSVPLEGMVSGGKAPYTYLWTSSVDGELGVELTLTSPALHTDVGKGVLTANKLTLLVVDANGLNATATVDVLVRAAVYLPLSLKQ